MHRPGDAGDRFRIVFRRPVGGVDAPSSELVLVGADGASGRLSHPNAEFAFTLTARSMTVTVQRVDLGGSPVAIALVLPAALTRLSGVEDARGRTLAAEVSPCSKDVVLA